MVALITALVVLYVWGDIRIALFVALGFCLAKALMKKEK